MKQNKVAITALFAWFCCWGLQGAMWWLAPDEYSIVWATMFLSKQGQTMMWVSAGVTIALSLVETLVYILRPTNAMKTSPPAGGNEEA